MARSDLHVKLTVDTSQLQAALDGLRWPLTPTMRRTLYRLDGMPRVSPRLYALIECPKASRKGGHAFQGAVGNAVQRLRAAAKAGLAHVAFEVGEETYEISARGRAALAGRT